MSEATATKFPCAGCGKSFIWKQELANKKVKCKCGTIILVPAGPAASEDAPDDVYDFAPTVEAPKPAKKPVVQPSIRTSPTTKTLTKAKSAATSAAPAAADSPVLGYRRPTTTNKVNDRFSLDNMMDMKRDVYAPITLLIAGLVLAVSYYAAHYHMGMTGIAFTTLGISGMTIFKTVLLVVFAMLTAGPLGVSYGGIWTGILKLAAIAVFSDGLTTWVDAGIEKMGAGGLSMLISYPVSLGVYWGLLIYLFSMDPGDSWMVVVLLSAFARIVQWVIVILLLNSVLSLGGVASVSPSGSNASSPGAAIAAEIQDLDDSGSLIEYKKWKQDGHVTHMTVICEGAYAAGAKNVSYSVSRDINGKMTPGEVFIELPEDKTKWPAIYKVVNDYHMARFKTTKPPFVDDGTGYIRVFVSDNASPF